MWPPIYDYMIKTWKKIKVSKKKIAYLRYVPEVQTTCLKPLPHHPQIIIQKHVAIIIQSTKLLFFSN